MLSILLQNNVAAVVLYAYTSDGPKNATLTTDQCRDVISDIIDDARLLLLGI